MAAKITGRSANGNSPKAGKLMAGSKNSSSTSMGGPPKPKASVHGSPLISRPKKAC